MTNSLLKLGKHTVALAFFFLLFSPISIFCEHACIDERPNGTTVERKAKLPREWFLIGDKLLTDQSLHSGIRSGYSANYVMNDEPYGVFCGIIEGVYVTVSNTELGPWAEFSSIPPKCWKCKTTNADNLKFISGSQLKIGQDKATAAAILGVEINGDIFEVLFQEKRKNKRGFNWHTESIKLEFKSGILIRFTVSDYTESA